jgi:type I restriction enzyme S subunit
MGEVVAGKALAAKAPGLQRPYLRTKNVLDGRIDLDDVLTMPMTDSEFEHFRLRDGDVLLNEGQSLELVGRCSIYRDEPSESFAIQNQLLRFRAHSGVSAPFAAHLFRHCQQSGVFTRIALQTTSVAHLGVSRFQRLRLLWPQCEEEQEAIANALSHMDTEIDALEARLAKTRALKQGMMQELLTGRTRLV